jgi:hypothetical protein
MKALNLDEVQAVSGGYNFFVIILGFSVLGPFPPAVSMESTVLAGATCGAVITSVEGFCAGEGFFETIATTTIGGIAGSLGGAGAAYLGYQIGSYLINNGQPNAQG